MQAPQPNGVPVSFTGTQFTKVSKYPFKRMLLTDDKRLKDIRASPYAKFFIDDTMMKPPEAQYSLYDLRLG
jgi:hypothetical protein